MAKSLSRRSAETAVAKQVSEQVLGWARWRANTVECWAANIYLAETLRAVARTCLYFQYQDLGGKFGDTPVCPLAIITKQPSSRRQARANADFLRAI